MRVIIDRTGFWRSLHRYFLWWDILQSFYHHRLGSYPLSLVTCLVTTRRDGRNFARIGLSSAECYVLLRVVHQGVSNSRVFLHRHYRVLMGGSELSRPPQSTFSAVRLSREHVFGLPLGIVLHLDAFSLHTLELPRKVFGLPSAYLRLDGSVLSPLASQFFPST